MFFLKYIVFALAIIATALFINSIISSIVAGPTVFFDAENEKMLPSDGFSDLTDDSILLLGGCYCLSGESEFSLSISRKRPKNLLPAQMMPAIRAMETKPLKTPHSSPGRLSQNGI